MGREGRVKGRGESEGGRAQGRRKGRGREERELINNGLRLSMVNISGQV